MKSLTPREISDWLRQNGQVEDPHRAIEMSSSVLHVQYYAPTQYSLIESLASRFVAEVFVQGDLLIHVDDWSPWHDSRVWLTKTIWPDFEAARGQEKVVGCLCSSEEREKAVMLFTLMSCFHWQCYLYGDHDQTALYNWEGEIFDAWTSAPAKIPQIQELFEEYKLTVVPK